MVQLADVTVGAGRTCCTNDQALPSLDWLVIAQAIAKQQLGQYAGVMFSAPCKRHCLVWTVPGLHQLDLQKLFNDNQALRRKKS